MVTLDKLEYQPLEFAATWDDEFKKFPYQRQPFGDFNQLAKWHKLGFTHKNFTGEMCPDQSITPAWAKNIGKILGWKDCGYTFYRMQVGDILPPHVDHFNKYKELFHIADSEDVMRCIVFLEDKKVGHMSEFAGLSISDWYRGYAVAWRGTVEHSALNIGYEPRYTLQITGHA